MVDFGEFRAAPEMPLSSHGLTIVTFRENAKIGIARGSADLEFLLGKSQIRAPGRRTRNGTFLTSSTYSNVS